MEVADLSIRNSSSLHYSNSESGDKMYCPVVLALTLEFGKMISVILRKPAKPSLNFFTICYCLIYPVHSELLMAILSRPERASVP